jgi:hypothetical protein
MRQAAELDGTQLARVEHPADSRGADAEHDSGLVDGEQRTRLEDSGLQAVSGSGHFFAMPGPGGIGLPFPPTIG